ncbi:hypothetical protein M9458_047060, partial [Cirrhinus mrigala]
MATPSPTRGQETNVVWFKWRQVTGVLCGQKISRQRSTRRLFIQSPFMVLNVGFRPKNSAPHVIEMKMLWWMLGLTLRDHAMRMSGDDKNSAPFRSWRPLATRKTQEAVDGLHHGGYESGGPSPRGHHKPSQMEETEPNCGPCVNMGERQERR